MGKPEDIIAVVQEGEVDAVAMADIPHYARATVDIRAVARRAGISVRSYEPM